MIVVYLLCPFLFSIFTKEKFRFTPSIISLGIITVWMIIIYFCTTSVIQDKFWANRVLHAVGGGFNIVLIASLALKDFKIKLPLPQIIIIVFMLATTLGVFNEIIEFFLQQALGWKFATIIEDTWLDLVSNLVGTILGLTSLSIIFKKDK